MPMLADAHISSLGYLWENTLSYAVEAARDLDLDFKWSCHGNRHFLYVAIRSDKSRQTLFW